MNVTATEFSRKHLTKHFKLCGEKYLLLRRKILFAVSFTDNTIHLRDSSNTLTKLLRDIMPLESVSAYSVILILTF